MPPEQSGPEDPQEWLARARGNLVIARSELPGVELAELCFNAHQAAEKAIKAVLIYQEVEYPYIHDLRRLLRLVAGSGTAVPEPVRMAARLTDYSVTARYPAAPQDRPSRSEYREAIADAEAVLRWAEELVGPSPES